MALKAPLVVGVPLNGPWVVGEGWLRVGAGVGVVLEIEVVELVVELEAALEIELEIALDTKLDTEEPEVSTWGAANTTASRTKREIHWSGNMVSYCMHEY